MFVVCYSDKILVAHLHHVTSVRYFARDPVQCVGDISPSFVVLFHLGILQFFFKFFHSFGLSQRLHDFLFLVEVFRLPIWATSTGWTKECCSPEVNLLVSTSAISLSQFLQCLLRFKGLGCQLILGLVARINIFVFYFSPYNTFSSAFCNLYGISFGRR